MNAGKGDRVLGGRFRPARRAGLLTVELDGEAVIFDAVTQVVHALNVTGTLVWHAADGTSTLDDLVTWLAGSYALPSDDVRDEVIKMVQDLLDIALLDDPQTSLPSKLPPIQ